MRIFISGTRSFGAKTFHLVKGLGHDIIGVSAPVEDPLARAAAVRGIEVAPAGSLTSETLPDEVDLVIAAHSHDFISRQVRDKAALGAIGYHPSLLPLHRGRDAVEWTIRMRDRVAGGTVFWLNDTVDGGPIAAQEHVLVRPDDNASSLWRRELFPLGLLLIKRVLHDLDNKVIRRNGQDHTLATWEPSIDQPRLYRPELPQIGPSAWDDYTVIAHG